VRTHFLVTRVDLAYFPFFFKPRAIVRSSIILSCSFLPVCILLQLLTSGRFLSVDCVQAAVLKEYPEKMVVTVAQCLFSTAQCLVVAVVAERDFSKWKLRLDVGSLAVLYSASSVFCFLLLFQYIFSFFCFIKNNSSSRPLTTSVHLLLFTPSFTHMPVTIFFNIYY